MSFPAIPPGPDERIAQADSPSPRANTRTTEAEALTGRREMRREQAENGAQAVRASELSYRRLFEAAPDGILPFKHGSAQVSRTCMADLVVKLAPTPGLEVRGSWGVHHA